MRKIFKEDLILKNNGRVDYCGNIGNRIRFIYDDVSGELDIINYEYIDYNKHYFICKYNDRVCKIHITSFLKGCLEYLVTSRTRDYTYSVGDVVANKIVLERLHKNTKKTYKVKCLKDGYEYEITEPSLQKSKTCPVCYGKVVIDGVNDIATTSPHLIKYFKNKDDITKYTNNSNKKVKMICPDCGREKTMSICSLFKLGRVACMCGDGFSYNEKYVASLLDQLHIRYEPQYSPEWIRPKRYDLYLNEYNIILETDGGFHFKSNTRNRMTVEETVQLDKEKELMALENGIYVVRINCDFDGYRVDRMKQTIYHVPFFSMFEITDEMLESCNEFAMSNIIKTACCMFMDGNTTFEIAEKLNIHVDTARRYVREGNKFGWCNYDYKKNNIEHLKEVQSKNKKAVLVYKDDEFLGEYDSASDLDTNSINYFGIKLDFRNISAVCNGKRKSYKGYVFKFK